MASLAFPPSPPLRTLRLAVRHLAAPNKFLRIPPTIRLLDADGVPLAVCSAARAQAAAKERRQHLVEQDAATRPPTWRLKFRDASRATLDAVVFGSEEVRLINAEGQNVGVMPAMAALEATRAAGMLVLEASARAGHIVWRMATDEAIAKVAVPKVSAPAATTPDKEVRIRAGVADHDFEVKARTIRRFLEKGLVVRVVASPAKRSLDTVPVDKLATRVTDAVADVIRGKKVTASGRGLALDLQPANPRDGENTTTHSS